MYSEIDDDALKMKWPSIESKPLQLYNIYLDRNVNSYHVDKTVHNFLSFLKLFPTHKVKFEASVHALIIFSHVSN